MIYSSERYSKIKIVGIVKRQRSSTLSKLSDDYSNTKVGLSILIICLNSKTKAIVWNILINSHNVQNNLYSYSKATYVCPIKYYNWSF